MPPSRGTAGAPPGMLCPPCLFWIPNLTPSVPRNNRRSLHLKTRTRKAENNEGSMLSGVTVKKNLSFFYNVFFSQNFQALFLWWKLIYFCSSPIWCIDDLMSMISNFPVCTCIYHEELEFLRFQTIYLHHNKITDAQTDFNTYTSLKDA